MCRCWSHACQKGEPKTWVKTYELTLYDFQSKPNQNMLNEDILIHTINNLATDPHWQFLGWDMFRPVRWRVLWSSEILLMEKSPRTVVFYRPPVQATKDRKGEKARELQRAQAGRWERSGADPVGSLGFADELWTSLNYLSLVGLFVHFMTAQFGFFMIVHFIASLG